MEKCLKCGRPLQEEGDRCVCNEGFCTQCCECGDGCSCECVGR